MLRSSGLSIAGFGIWLQISFGAFCNRWLFCSKCLQPVKWGAYGELIRDENFKI